VSLAATAIRILIISGFIAVWDVLLKPVYVSTLESRGEIYGFGSALIAYMAVIVVGWLVSSMVARRVDAE